VVLAAVPTGSLSATRADRGVTGTAASDANAYVGVEMSLERAADTAAVTSATGARANGTAGTNATASPTPTGPTRNTLFVTVTNRVPDLGGFVAVVTVERTRAGDVQTVSDRVLVDDEATATLSPVTCDDSVRIVVQSEDVRVAFTRPVPCGP
jgi:hypothetical protein